MANALWWSANAGRYTRFLLALQNPRVAQIPILNRYLRENAGTDFGQRHGFDRIRTVAEFQARVPLSDYEDYLPYIDRIASGASNVLTRNPVRCFVPTSGSSSAEKLIPYTDELIREFNRGIGPWIFDLFRRDPRLMGGRAYWSISPVGQRPRRSGVVPVGFEEDSAYVGGFAKRLVDSALAVPGSVRHIHEMESFRCATLLHLLRCRDLRLISIWHPSFLTLLLGALEPNWDRLLHELLQTHGDRDRAVELRRIGPHEPGRIWPSLRLISCWTDAAAALSVPQLQRMFPSFPIQGKGLLATEGFITLPLGRHRPLAVRSHFFEFLDDAGSALLADELRVGETYSVVVTTAGGLYRYRLHDLVEVHGFVGRTPSLRFIGKERSISDLRGEKLSEGFVAKVLAAMFERHQLSARFSMLAPDPEQVPPRYVLFIASDLLDRDAPDADALRAELAKALDQALCANPHYRYCRALGQLGASVVFPVLGDAHQQYMQRLCDEGRRLGNIKPAALSSSPLHLVTLSPCHP